MSIAQAIPVVIAARAARSAVTDAARLARDAFIQPEFALMAARFEQLLADALGLHSAITVTATPVVEAVQSRSFATLNKRVISVRSTLGATPQTVTFTPQLDFREQDQYGLIACSIDFAFSPRASRIDGVARALLERGIQMRGSSVSSLMCVFDGTLVELGSRDLEDAFTAWWLR
jgi:hypothetical protein